MRGERQSKTASVSFRSLVLGIANSTAVCAVALVCWGLETSHAQPPEFGVYARAVEFCRGQVKRPMALDLDRRVLCFDGPILAASDFSLASALEPNGLFVVRSPGGEAPTAPQWPILYETGMPSSSYDYCFPPAPAIYLASDQTFVVKDTLVAWHHAIEPLCPSLDVSKDGGPKRLEKAACSDTPAGYQAAYREFKDQNREFYASRVVDSQFEDPPQSFTMRRVLRSMFEGTGNYPNVTWTWHPRNHASTFKTQIIYEAYPSSQAEVDALASRLHLRHRILYDP